METEKKNGGFGGGYFLFLKAGHILGFFTRPFISNINSLETMSVSSIDNSTSNMDLEYSQNSNGLEINILDQNVNSIDIIEQIPIISSITSASQQDIPPDDAEVEELKREIVTLKQSLQQCRRGMVRLREALRQERHKTLTMKNDLTTMKRLYRKYF